jgi:hypothetical protein
MQHLISASLPAQACRARSQLANGAGRVCARRPTCWSAITSDSDHDILGLKALQSAGTLSVLLSILDALKQMPW